MINNEFYLSQMRLPFIALFCEIALHLLISRFWIRRGTIISTLIAYGICLLLLAVLQNQTLSNQLLPMHTVLSLSAVNFIFYSAMAFFYFSFVNIGESSVRIRILREISDSQNGVSQAELLRRYNVDHMIQARIERFLSSGEMVLRKDRYYYSGKPKMLLVAKTCQKIKKLLLGKESFRSERTV